MSYINTAFTNHTNQVQPSIPDQVQPCIPEGPSGVMTKSMPKLRLEAFLTETSQSSAEFNTKRGRRVSLSSREVGVEKLISKFSLPLNSVPNEIEKVVSQSPEAMKMEETLVNFNLTSSLLPEKKITSKFCISLPFQAETMEEAPGSLQRRESSSKFSLSDILELTENSISDYNIINHKLMSPEQNKRYSENSHLNRSSYPAYGSVKVEYTPKCRITPTVDRYINATIMPLPLTDELSLDQPGSAGFSVIATQAPLQETVVDFFEMAFVNRTKVVINLLSPKDIEPNPFSRGSIPAYWAIPGFVTTLSNGYEVHCTPVEVIPSGNGEKVLFSILNNKQETVQVVTMFRFTAWHDHDTVELSQFIPFLMMVQENDLSMSIIHCRVGVGRTGISIGLLDAIYRKNVGLQPLKPIEIVTCLRNYRTFMVPEEEQYPLLQEGIDYLSNM